MKNASTIIFFVIFFSSCSTEIDKNIYKNELTTFSTNLAFSNADKIYYFTASNKHLSTITDGYNPNISPDGLSLSYTDYYDIQMENAGLHKRRIAILDLKTGTKSIIDFPSSQFDNSIWSYDGNKLAFSVRNNDKWNIGISENGRVKILKPEIDCHSITWTADDKSILAHNLDTLFIIDTSSFVSSKIPIKEIVNTNYVSSLTTFTITPDNRYIIFNASNRDAKPCKGEQFHAELPYAIFKYDLLSKKLLKLTKDDFYCSDYTIIDDLIYFTASQCKESLQNVYTISLDGKNHKLVLKNANSITLARKSGE